MRPGIHFTYSSRNFTLPARTSYYGVIVSDDFGEFLAGDRYLELAFDFDRMTIQAFTKAAGPPLEVAFQFAVAKA
jgi:hypothetical protein